MRELTNNEKLERLFRYYEYLVDEFKKNPKPLYDTREAGNRNEIRYRLFEYMTSLYGVDGFPTIVSDEEYNDINCPVYYHGYKDYDHGANFLVHHNYHRGEGVDGDGFYVATNKSQAYRYTKIDNIHNKSEWDMGKVLEVKFQGKKRMLDLHLKNLAFVVGEGEKVTEDEATEEEVEKINELYSYLKTTSASEDVKKGFLKTIWMNESLLAIYLGADYIEVYDRDFNLSHLVILNRGKVVVKESEKNRFCGKSKHYKSGAYDYKDRDFDDGWKINHEIENC